MKPFKKFFKEKKLPSLETVDFRVNKKLPTLETVDFRDKKLNEEIHGPTEFYGVDDGKAHKEREDHHHNLMNHYTMKSDEHKRNITNYTIASNHLSKSLHKNEGRPEKYEENHVKHLDEQCSHHAAPHDFHVYSGLARKPTPGASHVHHAYISTSLHPHVAQNFAADLNDKGEKATMGDRLNKNAHKHILKLHIPKGSRHGSYVAHHSDQSSEREFLVGRGKKIHIHEKPEKFGNVHIWHGTIHD